MSYRISVYGRQLLIIRICLPSKQDKYINTQTVAQRFRLYYSVRLLVNYPKRMMGNLKQYTHIAKNIIP
jgi:hypothetical protein